MTSLNTRKRSPGFASLLAAAALAPISMMAQTTFVNWDVFQPAVYATPSTPTLDGYNFYDGDSTFGDDGSSIQLPPPGFGNGGPLQVPDCHRSVAKHSQRRLQRLGQYFNPSGVLGSHGAGCLYLVWLVLRSAELGHGCAGSGSRRLRRSQLNSGLHDDFNLPDDGSWIDEDFTSFGAVNKYLFSPLDSSGNPSQFLAGYIWMDNLTLTVPDAGDSGWLLGLGLAGLALVRRKLA